MNGGEDRVVQVPIGGLAVASPPRVLTTLLGSCVGMVVQDLRHHVAVVAHVVRAQGNSVGMGPAYFANLAAPRARDLAIQNGADPRQLVVRIAGGARMGHGSLGIGERNVEAVREATYALGMVFGGQLESPADSGCVLFADPASGKVLVRAIQSGQLDDSAWKRLLREVPA